MRAAACSRSVKFAIEAAATARALELADRLPLGAGLSAYMLAMATIRGFTGLLDWVASMRLTVAAVVLAVALVELGLAPLGFVAIITALVVGEATIEMNRHRSGGTSSDGREAGPISGGAGRFRRASRRRGPRRRGVLPT